MVSQFIDVIIGVGEAGCCADVFLVGVWGRLAGFFVEVVVREHEAVDRREYGVWLVVCRKNAEIVGTECVIVI